MYACTHLHLCKGVDNAAISNAKKHIEEVSKVMKKKLTTVDFRGTAEQEAKLLEVIAKYDGVQGKLMPILQEAQEIYG